MNTQPTVFHITHWKAGSQWVGKVLRECAPHRFVPQKVNIAHFLKDSIKPNGVYPGIYVAKERFEAVVSPRAHFDRETYARFRQRPIAFALNWFNYQVLCRPYVKFVVIRDLRDTLISWYFSLKISHPLLNERIARRRDALNSLDRDEGLIYLIENNIRGAANIQQSWLNDDTLLVKYEELLADEIATFNRIIDYCQIDVNRSRLREIVRSNSFKAVTGRERGEEDVKAHHRKGIAGDWRNHFSDRVKEEFKKKFGDTLIKTGYETDLDW